MTIESLRDAHRIHIDTQKTEIKTLICERTTESQQYTAFD